MKNYYYHNLKMAEKCVYKLLFNSMKKCETIISMPNILVNDLTKILKAISFDYPELFYVDFSQITIAKEFNCSTAYLRYLYEKNAISQMKVEMEEQVGIICRKINNNDGEYEIEKKIHDYIITKVNYEECAVKEPELYREAFTVYGAIVKKKAVCEGVAKLVKMILDRYSIDCIVCEGKSCNGVGNYNIEHAWNIVRINDDYYHLDVTWDLQNISLFEHQNVIKNYDYYNLSDEFISIDHTDISIIGLCKEMKENYHQKRGLVVRGKKKAIKIMNDNIINGKSFSFRLISTEKTPSNIVEIVNEMFKKSVEQYGKTGKKYYILDNPKQLVFSVVVK